MMRALVASVLLLACSHPPKHTDPQPPVAEDAAVVAIDAEAAAEAPADAAPVVVEKDFDWAKIRKRIEDARAERKGKPRPLPCGADDPHTICSPRPSPLAARGRLVGGWTPDHRTAVLILDVGAEDGVSEEHWAAVIDDNDKPITKYQRVENIRRTQCVVQLELPEMMRATRVALITKPPAHMRAGER